MDCSEFGPFAQRMLDLGLVFNITFTEGELAELRAHANWAMFDRKFMDGISTLPAGLELPPWPLNIRPSVSGVCLNSLLTVSQRNSVWVMIEGWGETRGVR